MARPVHDPSNVSHFLPVLKTAQYIADNNMSFDRVKKKLPEVNKNPFQKEEDKLDKT